MSTDKEDVKSYVPDMPQDTGIESYSIPYIDPDKERKIVRKFDWLVLPQFVIIIVLGYGSVSNSIDYRCYLLSPC